jgi:hypothetical protein
MREKKKYITSIHREAHVKKEAERCGNKPTNDLRS